MKVTYTLMCKCNQLVEEWKNYYVWRRLDVGLARTSYNRCSLLYIILSQIISLFYNANTIFFFH